MWLGYRNKAGGCVVTSSLGKRGKREERGLSPTTRCQASRRHARDIATSEANPDVALVQNELPQERRAGGPLLEGP